MADEEEGGVQYVLTTENNEVKPTSRNYNGKAVANYANGDSYDGMYSEGIREGRGCYMYASLGEKYDGEWVKNMKHGIGKMNYAKDF